MITSIDLSACEPFYSHSFLGSGNLLLTGLVRSGFPFPFNLHHSYELNPECATGKTLDVNPFRQASSLPVPNLFGCMECMSTFIVNSRRLY